MRSILVATLIVLLPMLAGCPSGEDGSRCSSHSDCDDNLICTDDECADPYGRRWRLSVVSAQLSAHDPTGDTWDSGGGDPDPFVVIKVDDAVVLTTQVKTDTRMATFEESTSFVLEKRTTFQATVYDDDILFDSAVVTTGAQDVEEEELRAGQLSYAASTGPSRDGGVDNTEVTQLVLRWELD